VNTDTQDTGGEVEHATRQTGNAQEKPWFVIITKKDKKNQHATRQLETLKKSLGLLIIQNKRKKNICIINTS
jgi:hypothetical protein